MGTQADQATAGLDGDQAGQYNERGCIRRWMTIEPLYSL